MTDPVWSSPYPIQPTGLELTLYPRRVVIRYRQDKSDRTLELIGGGQIGPICNALDSCLELRIHDTNRQDGGQREFGRYRLEVWDEEGPVETLLFDSTRRRRQQPATAAGPGPSADWPDRAWQLQ